MYQVPPSIAKTHGSVVCKIRPSDATKFKKMYVLITSSNFINIADCNKISRQILAALYHSLLLKCYAINDLGIYKYYKIICFRVWADFSTIHGVVKASFELGIIL